MRVFANLLRRKAMIELSNERIEHLLYEVTEKKIESVMILRSIYTRYMLLYERYFADIDALNDAKIAELREYHEETKSLVKYFYMDIPQDVCMNIKEFEKIYSDNLLGSNWHKYLFDNYEDFTDKNWSISKSEKSLKAEFTKQTLEGFYDAMDYVFRDGFKTGFQLDEKAVSGLGELLFRKE